MTNHRYYKEIAPDVYRVDKRKYSRYLEETNTTTNNNYKVLKVEDNQNNGMQAMAVVPVNDRGEVDTSKIVIA